MENPTIQTNASDGTVGKALVMLDLVASFERPVRFSEILSKSAYPKATVYRLLQTLSNQSICLLYTSPSPRDYAASRMPSSA